VTTVPAGKLLVIEQVSAFCLLSTGQRILTLELRIAPYSHLLVSSFNGSRGSYDYYVSSQHVRLYAPAGASVFLFAFRNANTGDPLCQATLTSSLIDQPGAN
jgi:hypothetical protein